MAQLVGELEEPEKIVLDRVPYLIDLFVGPIKFVSFFDNSIMYYFALLDCIEIGSISDRTDVSVRFGFELYYISIATATHRP